MNVARDDDDDDDVARGREIAVEIVVIDVVWENRINGVRRSTEGRRTTGDRAIERGTIDE